MCWHSSTIITRKLFRCVENAEPDKGLCYCPAGKITRLVSPFVFFIVIVHPKSIVCLWQVSASSYEPTKSTGSAKHRFTSG
jgi:hypothetical protein